MMEATLFREKVYTINITYMISVNNAIVSIRLEQYSIISFIKKLGQREGYSFQRTNYASSPIKGYLPNSQVQHIRSRLI